MTTEKIEWNAQFQASFRDTQRNTIWVALGIQMFLGILVMYAGLQFPEHLWLALCGLLLILGSGGAWWLQPVNFNLASIVLTAGLLLGDLLAVFVGHFFPAVYLLPVPVGLMTVLMGARIGVLLACLFSAAIFWLPVERLPLDAMERLTTAATVWATIGLILLVLRPLLNSVEWVWQAYLNNADLLKKSRDYQARLQQNLEDMAQLNIQLTRLNHLTSNLREEAENERQAKREFVANVSHELRTPLNMIIGFCEMILKNPEAYGKRGTPLALLSDLDVVLRNSQHLSSLIDDVLDLSQIEANQMHLAKEWTSVQEIVNAAVIAIHPLFASKKLSLQTEVCEDLPLIYCDRTRIREVLLNLLSNAGRFTQEGGVRLRVWQESNWMIIGVVDTGPGIAPEGKEKLFQPFQQLDSTTRRKYGGTGLGLAISKSFVELHDGKMWVESEVGKGTTFFFRLPIEPLAAIKSGPARWFNQYPVLSVRTHSISHVKAATLRPRVVVVDHTAILPKILGRYQETAELVFSLDINDGLNQVTKETTSMLVVNSRNIGSTLAELKEADPPLGSTPVVVCSLSGAEQAVMQLGVINYLVKPVAQEELLAAVRAVGNVRVILIVDDEPDMLKLFHRMIAASGQPYRILQASNGQEAIDILESQKVDLILLDYVMPEMNGVQFLAVKRNHPQ